MLALHARSILVCPLFLFNRNFEGIATASFSCEMKSPRSRRPSWQQCCTLGVALLVINFEGIAAASFSCDNEALLAAVLHQM